jgi:tetratricopeptide (TPR) repeat protein
MRAPSASLLLLLLLAAPAGGCAGVTPRVDRATAADVPSVQLSPAEQASVRTHVERAMAAVIRRQFDEAGEAAEVALAIDPRAARARAVRALVIAQRGAVEDPPNLQAERQAECELVIAGEIAPNDAFVGWVHALFLAEAGHLSAAAEVAEATLRRAGNAPPSERSALLGIAGRYRYELGEERLALPLLQDYVSLRPDDVAARFRLGYTLLRLSSHLRDESVPVLLDARWQSEGAVAAFTRCAEQSPGDDDVHMAIATARLRAAEVQQVLGRVARDEADRATARAAADAHRQQAAAVLRAVAERFPANAEPVFRLAVLDQQRNDLAAAKAGYEQALAIDARHLGSLLNLARLCADAGEPERAATLLREALASESETARLTDDEKKRIHEFLRQP